MVNMTTTTEPPEQLTLLPADAVPVRFRLDEATRRRGLAHIAEIRAQLDRSRAERAAQATTGRGRSRVRDLPIRHTPARQTKPHAA